MAYVFYVEPLMNLSHDPVASVLYLHPDSEIGTFEMSLDDFRGGKNLWLAHLSSEDRKEIYILSLKVSGSGDCRLAYDLKKEVQLKFVSKGEQFHVVGLALDSKKDMYYLKSGKGELNFSFKK